MTAPRTRTLTLEQLRRAGACEKGRRIFREQCGTSAEVSQEWAARMARYIEFHDWTWAAFELLPRWAAEAYCEARGPHPHDRPKDELTRLSAAAFASLYVACADPELQQ